MFVPSELLAPFKHANGGQGQRKRSRQEAASSRSSQVKLEPGQQPSGRGRAASGGALASKPPRATRNQPEPGRAAAEGFPCVCLRWGSGRTVRAG